MKKLMVLILALTASTAGCTKHLIESMNKDTHLGVFQEYSSHNKIPPGYAELTIIASLKTPELGRFADGSKVRGTPDYMLLINIDGQRTLVKGDLRKEISDPKGLDDTEAGEGIRYLFNKELLLKPGDHKLFVALPEDNIAMERELTLTEGSRNVLHIYPIYGFSEPGGTPGHGLFSSSSFMNGITGFWVYLYGHEI